MENRILIVIALLMIVSCSTRTGTGYAGISRDIQLSTDIFRVSFLGNAFATDDQVEDFALLRAAELALTNGARYFVVLSSTDKSMDVISTTDSPEFIPSGNGLKLVNSISVNSRHRPGISLKIKTLAEKADGCYDANFIINAVRTKYKINGSP